MASVVGFKENLTGTQTWEVWPLYGRKKMYYIIERVNALEFDHHIIWANKDVNLDEYIPNGVL